MQDESFKTEKPAIKIVKLIGAASSPTPYKITTPKEHFVYCGADILLNGVQGDLAGEATCIVCGRSTRISFAGGKISNFDPVGAVLHVVEIRSLGRTQIVCEASPLFDREECLQSWLKNYKGLPGRTYTLGEFIPRASELVSERVGPAGSQSKSLSKSGIAHVIRCADCDCSPIECADSKSAISCPNCTLESCCCWVPSGPIS